MSSDVIQETNFAPPPAYLCQATRQVMADPVLSLCGHLFDRSVLKRDFRCPVDQTLVVDGVSCSELKGRIEAWKVDEVGRLGATVSKMALRDVRPVHVIQNAHLDDIHGFLRLKQGHFVSGAKDGYLKVWDMRGKLCRELSPGTDRRGYKYWVTALSRFSDGCWASGSRDGLIITWDQNQEISSNLQYTPSARAQESYVCKGRNKSRINCITELDATRFYTGTPCYIQLWDRKTQKISRYYKANDNDWVYCIEVLENRDLIVVIGSDLELWRMQDAAQPARESLIKESLAERRAWQRPHISAITRLEHERNFLAAALFNGAVRVVDIAAQKIVRDYSEHQRRVWSVINLRPWIFASSADDHTIKIWDLREQNSICTLRSQPGRVSSLLRISEHVFISGSCPDDVMNSKEKASIAFWDIRQVIPNVK